MEARALETPQRTTGVRGRALRRSDFPSQKQRLSLLMSRRRAASHLPTNGELRKQTTFNSLAGTRTGRSDGRSSPPAVKCAVCIGATAASQADMGMKARWRKHIRALRGAKEPLARLAANAAITRSIRRPFSDYPSKARAAASFPLWRPAPPRSSAVPSPARVWPFRWWRSLSCRVRE